MKRCWNESENETTAVPQEYSGIAPKRAALSFSRSVFGPLTTRSVNHSNNSQFLSKYFVSQQSDSKQKYADLLKEFGIQTSERQPSAAQLDISLLLSKLGPKNLENSATFLSPDSSPLTHNGEPRTFDKKPQSPLLKEIEAMVKSVREGVMRGKVASMEKARQLDAARMEREKDMEKMMEQLRIRLKISVKIKPLTQSEKDRLAAMWRLPETTLISDKYRTDVKVTDLTRLYGLNWLNDEIVNFYVSLCAAEVEENEALKGKTHLFNTFFWTMVSKGGHEKVKRWTRRQNIFAKELIIVPINKQNVHWALGVVDNGRKEIHYYDSMNGCGLEFAKVMNKYLQEEFKEKNLSDQGVAPFGPYKYIPQTDVPQQTNGSDCGVFVCVFTRYVMFRRPIDFEADQMPVFRERIILEIMDNKLLDLA